MKSFLLSEQDINSMATVYGFPLCPEPRTRGKNEKCKCMKSKGQAIPTSVGIQVGHLWSKTRQAPGRAGCFPHTSFSVPTARARTRPRDAPLGHRGFGGHLCIQRRGPPFQTPRERRPSGWRTQVKVSGCRMPASGRGLPWVPHGVSVCAPAPESPRACVRSSSLDSRQPRGLHAEPWL